VVLVQSLGELVNGRRGLQALVQNTALTLETHVLGPLDVASNVSAGQSITTDGEGLRAALKESVVAGLLGGLLASSRSGSSTTGLTLDLTLSISLWL
jgi:hypothetical protein